MISAISFDLDGTLLNDDNEILQGSINAIKRLHDLGVKIIISTSRHLSECKKAILPLYPKYIDFIICSGGLYIYNNTDSLLYTGTFLDRTRCLEIKHRHADETICFVGKEKDFYIDGITKSLLYSLYDWLKKKNRRIIFSVNLLPNQIEKVIVRRKGVQPFQKSDDCDFFSIHHFNNRIEYTDKKCTKMNALSVLSDMGEISLESTAVFGDDENDLECFEQMNYCVAMGNADPVIKKKAYFVTDSNNFGGISAGISRILDGSGVCIQ